MGVEQGEVRADAVGVVGAARTATAFPEAMRQNVRKHPKEARTSDSRGAQRTLHTLKPSEIRSFLLHLLQLTQEMSLGALA